MRLRTGVVALALTVASSCGGGSNPIPPPPPVPTSTPVATSTPVPPTPTPAPGPAPIACSTPPLNPLPNPIPSTPYIDSNPTGLCLRNGNTGTVEFTNRSNNEALVFSDYQIVDKEVASAQFNIAANTCDQLNGRTLFPAAICRIEVRASCSSAPSRAKLRISSNAQNARSYDVQLTCNQ